MNDILYNAVICLDNLTKQQILVGIVAIIAIVGLIVGGYYLGTEQSKGTQDDALTVDSTEEAANTTEDVQEDLQNVSQDLKELESLF